MKVFLYNALFLISVLFVSCKKENLVEVITPYGAVAKVISFNIRHTGEETADGINRWENRKNAVLEMIKTEGPSFFGLQEVMPEQMDYLKDALPQYNCVGVERDGMDTESEGTPIFYLQDIYEMIDWGTFWLSNTPDKVSIGWDSSCHRIVTWAQLQEKESGAIVYYLNTHLDWAGSKSRKESIKVISNFIKKNISPSSPVIVGGDMNTTDLSIFNPLFSAGFWGAREIASVSDNLTTYNGWGKVTDMAIDHFLVRQMVVKSFRTLEETYGVPFISDHNPISMIVDY